ncbi:DNA-binding protein [Sulfurifustis variabilis]|uniref:DNA-binding protein n=1 Tax=Sulfurifustis variabilis TaxID=1675686 RepID=A0A1B4V921_9GAMM|nr:DNA-binding protein [Sulfurifustis variabilis]
MQTAVVALMANGFRPDTNRPGRHMTLVQALPTTIGLSGDRLAVPDTLRRKRNLSDYNRGGRRRHLRRKLHP